MEHNISVIVPFETRKQYRLDKSSISILLFGKKILDKYSALGMYGFDDAAMVFLEQIAEEEKKQGKEIKKQIEFTVKLMLLHQNRNRLARDVINENTAFQKNITNHVMVNLNRLLTVDKRVYSELNQISRNNVKLKEAYDKIVKLENYEKKLVFQVNSQQTIRPKTLQRSFYQMFNHLLKQSQMKLSSEIFKESTARKQFKQNLNKLLELKTFQSDVKRHEFLHIMKHGTLEERREAMEILQSAVMEVNQNMISNHVWNNSLVFKNLKVGEERMLQVMQQGKQEKEIRKIQRLLQKQQTIQIEDHRMFEQLKVQFSKQDEIIREITKEQEGIRKQGSPDTISAAISKQLKSEIHFDKMRYGME